MTERAGMPFWKFFSEECKLEWCSKTFFSGIDITNTSPSPTEFWAALCVLERIFFRKIALSLTNNNTEYSK
jgi:hypothetical protein